MNNGLLESTGNSGRILRNRFVLSFTPRCLAIFWSSQEPALRQWTQSTGWLASSNSRAVRASLDAFSPRVLTTIPSATGVAQAVTGASLPSTSTKQRRQEAKGSFLSRTAQRLGMYTPLSRAAHRTFSPGAALIVLPSIVRETRLAFVSTLSLVPSGRKISQRSYVPARMSSFRRAPAPCRSWYQRPPF
jgi:hypothetical protein